MTEARDESLIHRKRPCASLVVLAVICLGGCITATRRGYPLYPNPPLLERQRVAFLTGYVRDVDGNDVSQHGEAFDLLPGCHIVGTPSESGNMDPTEGAVITTGPHKFALPMKVGHSYVIEVEAADPSSGTTESRGTVRLWAREIDEAGKTTRRFSPATSPADLQACM